MTTRNVGFRLGMEGKAEIRNDFAEIQRAGEAAMQDIAASAEQAAQRAVAANDEWTARQIAGFKKQAAAAKLNAAGLSVNASFDEALSQRGSTRQNATVNLDRSTGSARASAAVFEEAFRAEEKAARETAEADREAARTAEERAAAVAKLRAAIDPLAVAQARYAKEVADADKLLSAGAISTREHAAAIQMYGTRLQQTREAIDGTANAEERLQARTRAFLAALDPAIAAQQRFDREMAEAKTLIGAGTITLDQYCDKLRDERRLLDDATGAKARATASAGAMRQAMAGASYQVQDLATQISMGANPINALVVQGGQLAGQFMNVEGKAGAVARFMMGGWGLALQIGLMAIAPLVEKLWETSEASQEAKRALEAQRKAVLDLADAQGKAILTAERKQALDVAAVKLAWDQARATREQTQAELERARANLLSAKQRAEDPTQNGEFNAGAAAAALYERQVADLQRRLDQNAGELRRLTDGGNAAIARLVVMQREARSTPQGAVEERYRVDVSRLQREFRGSPRELDAQVARLNAARDAELKQIEKTEQATRKLASARDGETLSASAVAKMLRETLPGVHVTSTTGGKHVANSYHYRPGGQAVDFVPAGGMSSMTKDDVRRIFESRGIDVVELLGPGDRGHSDHFHVAWAKGKLALDEFTDAAKRAQRELLLLREIQDGARQVDVGDLIRSRQELFDRAAQNVLGGSDALSGQIMSGQQMAAIEDADRDIEQRRLEMGRDRIQQLSGFYRDMFNGGTSSMWDFFRERGLETISDLLAKWTLGEKGMGAGGLLGMLGSLFRPSDTKLGQSIAAQGIAALPKNAVGTEYWSGGLTWVAENGPELINLPRGARVTPAGETRRIVGANDNRGGGDTHVHFHGEGAVLGETVKGWIAEGMAIASMRGAAGGARMGADDMARNSRRRIRR